MEQKLPLGLGVMMEVDLFQGMCVFMSMLVVHGLRQVLILKERLLVTSQDILFL